MEVSGRESCDSHEVMKQFADLLELLALCVGMASLVFRPLFLLPLVVLNFDDSLVGIVENGFGSTMATGCLDGRFHECDVRLADFLQQGDVIEVTWSRRQDPSSVQNQV